MNQLSVYPIKLTQIQNKSHPNKNIYATNLVKNIFLRKKIKFNQFLQKSF